MTKEYEELKKTRETIKKLQESFAAEKKKYEEVKGYGECTEKSPCDDTLYQMSCYVDRCISSLYQSIWNLEDKFYTYTYEHSRGHIPAINSPEKLENALKTLGIDKDYQILKPVVMASDRRGNITIDLSSK